MCDFCNGQNYALYDNQGESVNLCLKCHHICTTMTIAKLAETALAGYQGIVQCYDEPATYRSLAFILLLEKNLVIRTFLGANNRWLYHLNVYAETTDIHGHIFDMDKARQLWASTIMSQNLG